MVEVEERIMVCRVQGGVYTGRKEMWQRRVAGWLGHKCRSGERDS